MGVERRLKKPRSELAKPLTSRDVARILGVSQSMISRAFDPGASVAPQKRSHIVEAAAALGYRPNVIARSLSTQSSRIVGIIIGTMDNPFYPQVLERLSKALQKAGYQSLLFSVPPGREVDDQLPFLLQYNVDAVIVASATLSSGIAREWTKIGRRAVFFNRTIPDASVGSVSCDNYEGGRMAADHLVGLGRRRLAFVAGRRDTSTNSDRERGFLARLDELGMALHARAEGGDYAFAAGYAAALALAPAQPDAVFFANDILALGGMDAMRHVLGLRVPQDVAVIGFDDIAMAAWPSYRLTTIRQPVEAMIEETVALIAGTPGDGDRPGSVTLPGVLVERNTTGMHDPGLPG